MYFPDKMKYPPGYWRVFVLALILSNTTMATAANPGENMPKPTPKAVFIILDGIAADVLESTPTPNLDEISGDKGYTRAYVGGVRGQASESPTISASGYNSLLTGTWSNKNNVWDNEVNDPDYGYWDIFRIAKAHDATLHTALFSTWTENRTRLLGNGLEAAGGDKLDYHFDGFELDTEQFPHDIAYDYLGKIDNHVTDEAARYISVHGPDLSWVYLEHTDDIGHMYGDGPELIAEVVIMDQRVGKIWQAVKSRQRDHDENWMILITTDHGRDAETGMGHGGQTERERTVWFVTNGADLRERYYQMPAMVDVLPSIVTHLGLDMPEKIREQLDGESFID